VRLAKTAGQGRLFPHRQTGWLNDNVERLCREAGCERMTPHGLRGTHSTLAVRGGMSAHLVVDALGEVSRSMGHGSTRVTREHYVDPAALKARGTATLLRVLEGGNSGRSSG
jgi:integrase